MAQIAEQQEVLAAMLGPLCGAGGAKDPDDTVREALAEALLLLARTPVLTARASRQNTMLAESPVIASSWRDRMDEPQRKQQKYS